jgi:hypothetical protein
LATPPVGQSHRVSSNEQPNWNVGNNDMTRLDPGEVFNFPLLKGPGYINHIWFTSHAGGEGALNYLTLRIYYDGRSEPGVEAPLGDFFACGNRPAIVESYPVQVSESGALTCYWRMPFAKSCRIEIINDSPDMQTGLYWQVDYVELPEPLPPHTPYFYARYRQEYPAVMGRDYTIAEIEGRGKYVGTVMSVTMAQDGWFGEGDDFFYIDGEEIPSLQGTGSEDYFNDAWGFRERTSLWFGQPWWTGDKAGDQAVCYRWHVLDPVNFETSLKLTIEHKGNLPEAHEGFFVERPDFISSVAFWYQEGQPRFLMGSIPGYPERCVPWLRHLLAKSFLKIETTGGAKPELRGTGLFEATPFVHWPNADAGATLSIPFAVVEDGNYVVRLHAFKSPEYGVFDFEIDGHAVAQSVSFKGESGEFDLRVGVLDLAAGEHTLAFRCVTPGGLAIEKLNLLKLPPMAVREVKGSNERHFVKLALGSAIYRHRLIYGEMPTSLEPLVEKGILDPRFLKDENLYDLRSRLEGDALIVESTAPEHWTHSWRGLDPRR